MTTIDQELELIKIELEKLEQKKSQLLERRKALLVKHSTAVLPTVDITSLTTQQKVALFARLFRGRDDIYAVRWENKQGRNGYSVACANEWQ